MLALLTNNLREQRKRYFGMRRYKSEAVERCEGMLSL
jgi:hypothetical protein